MTRFKARIYTAETSGNDSKRSREKMSVEVVGKIIEFDKLGGHFVTTDGDTDLAMTVTFVGEELGNCLGISDINCEAVASFGGIDDQLTTR